VVSESVTANYFALRKAHFRFTLKSWFRGLDKAVIAAVAVLQFMLTAIVIMVLYGLALALGKLADPAADLLQRGAVVAGWQLVSFILLRSLREAALMPRARAFFDTLPIPIAQELRADLWLSALGYTFLWLPVAWVAFDPLGEANGPAPGLIIALAGLVLISLCVNITWLRGAGREALMALAALAAFALLRAPGAAWEAARFGCVLLAGWALWRSYLPRKARAPRRRRAAGGRLALASGLVLPLLLHELRANVLVRAGVIGATFAACLLVIALRTNDTSGASVLVFVAATATLALYTLPALIRSTLLGKLEFLAGQPRFARRMRLATYGIPVAIFAAALALAWIFDGSQQRGVEALLFSALFLLGVTGARLKWHPTSWVMPFLTLVALIILGAMT
jgi:hypothetical protein